jgi:DNA-binding MarR family transcriptional regulator
VPTRTATTAALGDETRHQLVTSLDHAMLLLVRRANLPRTHELFARRAGVSLERGAIVVLARLDEFGPIRPSELARILGVEPSTATRHVQDLQRRRLVDKHPDPSDGRSCVVEMTAEGRETLRRFRHARFDLFDEIVADWDADAVAALASGLGRFVEDLARLTDDPR